MQNSYIRVSLLAVIAMGALIATLDAHVKPPQTGRLVVVNQSNESAQIQVIRGDNWAPAGAVGPRSQRSLSVTNGERFRALVGGQVRSSHTVSLQNGADTWAIR